MVTSGIRKRSWHTSVLRIAVVASAAAMVLAACGSSGGANSGADGGGNAPASDSGGSGATIKVGFMDALSGTYANDGVPEYEAAMTAVNLTNAKGGIDGKKVQIVKVDDLYTPAGATSGIQKLASEGVHVAVASTNTDNCEAYLPLLSQLNMTVVSDDCTAGPLTGPNVNARFFRVSDTSPESATALGQGLCQIAKGATRIDSITLAVNTPTNITNGAVATAKSVCGMHPGTVVSVPATATNVLPYVEALLSKRASNSASSTVLQVSLFGDTLLSFVRAAEQAGVFQDYKAVGTATSGWAEGAAALYPNVPSVYFVSQYYYGESNSKANSDFISAFKKESGGKVPDAVSYAGYQAMSALLAAIAKAGSSNPAAVASALKGLTYSTVVGNITINPATHQGNPELVFTHYDGAKVAVISKLPTCSTCAETFKY